MGIQSVQGSRHSSRQLPHNQNWGASDNSGCWVFSMTAQEIVPFHCPCSRQETYISSVILGSVFTELPLNSQEGCPGNPGAGIWRECSDHLSLFPPTVRRCLRKGHSSSYPLQLCFSHSFGLCHNSEPLVSTWKLGPLILFNQVSLIWSPWTWGVGCYNLVITMCVIRPMDFLDTSLWKLHFKVNVVFLFHFDVLFA